MCSALQPRRGRVKLHRLARPWVDHEHDRPTTRALQTREEEPCGFAIEQRTQDVAAEGALVVSLEGTGQVTHVLADVGGGFGRPDDEPPPLVARSGRAQPRRLPGRV